jgi:putative FmdB family regulatory protein
MPTYEFCCKEEDCKHEWEEWLNMTASDPDVCPKCKKQSVKKLISLGGKGVVELTGQDLVDKTKADIKQLKKDMHKNENVYADLLGHDKYESLQKRMDKQKRR